MLRIQPMRVVDVHDGQRMMLHSIVSVCSLDDQGVLILVPRPAREQGGPECFKGSLKPTRQVRWHRRSRLNMRQSRNHHKVLPKAACRVLQLYN